MWETTAHCALPIGAHSWCQHCEAKVREGKAAWGKWPANSNTHCNKYRHCAINGRCTGGRKGPFKCATPWDETLANFHRHVLLPSWSHQPPSKLYRKQQTNGLGHSARRRMINRSFRFTNIMNVIITRREMTLIRHTWHAPDKVSHEHREGR